MTVSMAMRVLSKSELLPQTEATFVVLDKSRGVKEDIAGEDFRMIDITDNRSW